MKGNPSILKLKFRILKVLLSFKFFSGAPTPRKSVHQYKPVTRVSIQSKKFHFNCLNHVNLWKIRNLTLHSNNLDGWVRDACRISFLLTGKEVVIKTNYLD